MMLFKKMLLEKTRESGVLVASTPSFASRPVDRAGWALSLSLLSEGPDPRLCPVTPVAPAPTFRFLARRGPLPSTPLCMAEVPLALSPSARVGQLVAEYPLLPLTQEGGTRPCCKSTFIAACCWLTRSCRGDCMK